MQFGHFANFQGQMFLKVNFPIFQVTCLKAVWDTISEHQTFSFCLEKCRRYGQLKFSAFTDKNSLQIVGLRLKTADDALRKFSSRRIDRLLGCNCKYCVNQVVTFGKRWQLKSWPIENQPGLPNTCQYKVWYNYYGP